MIERQMNDVSGKSVSIVQNVTVPFRRSQSKDVLNASRHKELNSSGKSAVLPLPGHYYTSSFSGDLISSSESRKLRTKIGGVWMQFRVVSKYWYLSATEFPKCISNDDKATLYSFYQQATLGPNMEPRKYACFLPIDMWSATNIQLLKLMQFLPAATETSGRIPGDVPTSSNSAIDWQLWKNLGNMSSKEAATKFIAHVAQMEPEYLDKMVTMNMTIKNEKMGIPQRGRPRSLPPVKLRTAVRRISRGDALNIISGTIEQINSHKLAIKELVVYEAAAVIQALMRGYIYKKRALYHRFHSLSAETGRFVSLLTEGLLVDRLIELKSSENVVEKIDDLSPTSSVHNPLSCKCGLISHEIHNGVTLVYERCYLKLNQKSNMEGSYLCYSQRQGTETGTTNNEDQTNDSTLSSIARYLYAPSPDAKSIYTELSASEGLLYVADIALSMKGCSLPSSLSSPSSSSSSFNDEGTTGISLYGSRNVMRFKLPCDAKNKCIQSVEFTVDQMVTLFDIVVDQSLSTLDFRGRSRYLGDRLAFVASKNPPSTQLEVVKIISNLQVGFGVEVFDPLNRTLVLKFLWFSEDVASNGDISRSIHIGDAHTLNRPGVSPMRSRSHTSLSLTRVGSTRDMGNNCGSKSINLDDIVEIREGLISRFVDIQEGYSKNRTDSLLTIVTRTRLIWVNHGDIGASGSSVNNNGSNNGSSNGVGGIEASPTLPSITLSFSSQTFRDEILRNFQRLISVHRSDEILSLRSSSSTINLIG